MSRYWNDIYLVSDDELEHYGVLGMKWGVRRYQNADGSYTAKGLKRKQKQEHKANKKDSDRASKYSSTLSDDEINKRINRLNSEKRLKELNREVNHPFASKVKSAASSNTAKVAGAVITATAVVVGKKAITKVLGKKLDGAVAKEGAQMVQEIFGMAKKMAFPKK